MTYTVTIKPSGNTFSASENESIIDAAARAGFSTKATVRHAGVVALAVGEVGIDEREILELRCERASLAVKGRVVYAFNDV